MGRRASLQARTEHPTNIAINDAVLRRDVRTGARRTSDWPPQRTEMKRSIGGRAVPALLTMPTTVAVSIPSLRICTDAIAPSVVAASRQPNPTNARRRGRVLLPSLLGVGGYGDHHIGQGGRATYIAGRDPGSEDSPFLVSGYCCRSNYLNVGMSLVRKTDDARRAAARISGVIIFGRGPPDLAKTSP
jgi:hypothetical protein